MSDYYQKSRSSNPPSYWDQGAAERQRDTKRFEDWFSYTDKSRRTPYSY